MSVPDFQSLMRPILVALADGAAHSSNEIRDAVAASEGVSDVDRQEMLPSGKQSTYSNRVAWALSHLGQAMLIDRVARGTYRIAERGQAALDANPTRVDMGVLNQFPEYVDFRKRKHVDGSDAELSPASDLPPSEAMAKLTAEADAEVAGDLLLRILLLRILQMPPAFLERLALHLLRAMGYGGKDSALEHTGKSGDAGLDGIVKQDALGLELVGMQAKRYAKDTAVQRPEVQAFVGALNGAQTSGGIFFTTGRFSAGAREYADTVGMRLILIDGPELTRLMVRYNVGVSIKESFHLTQIDDDFFDD